MKNSILVGAIVATLFTALPAVAQQQAPGQKVPVQAAPSPQTFDKQLGEAQALMKRMQEQMDSIRQTQDAPERQRLMQEHWTTMQSAMAAMHGMWGPGMMGNQGMMGGSGMMGCCGSGSGMMGNQGMMGWGRMSQYYSRLTPERLKQRQYMMDQYVGMQQMMMDHMLMRQQWMMQPSPPTSK